MVEAGMDVVSAEVCDSCVASSVTVKYMPLALPYPGSRCAGKPCPPLRVHDGLLLPGTSFSCGSLVAYLGDL